MPGDNQTIKMRTNETTTLMWECYRLPGAGPAGDWMKHIEDRLSAPECPYHFDRKGWKLRMWRKAARPIPVRGSEVTYIDGSSLMRADFGQSCRDEVWVGVEMARVCFEKGGQVPSKRSAAELFAAVSQPKPLRHLPLLPEIAPLIDFLAAPDGGLRGFTPVEGWTSGNASEGVDYYTRDGRYSLDEMIGTGGSPAGLLHMVRTAKAVRPARILLVLLDWGGVNLESAKQSATETRKVLEDWGCEVIPRIIQAPGELEDCESHSSGMRTVVMVPLLGKKGQRPPDAAMECIRTLNRKGVAFSLYSLATNPTYARHGLATVILAKAGGCLFRVHPKQPEKHAGCLFVGLDLGRGGRISTRIAAITLTDADGQLLAYWRALKNETESLPRKVLLAGLRWISERAREVSPDAHLVVIRDGRLPKDESVADYEDALEGAAFTLIEYAKSGAPLIHSGNAPPPPGTLIRPPGAITSTIYPCRAPQDGVLTSPAKFTLRRNPLHFSKTETAAMLIALCHAPTLSFQQAGVPAPVQWANGFGALTMDNLQYAGWSHLPHETTDLRAE